MLNIILQPRRQKKQINQYLVILKLIFMYYLDHQCFSRYFYTESKSDYYIVQPEHIAPGLIYVTSYTSYKNCSQWHRVKILREVDSKTVQVSVSLINIEFHAAYFINNIF
jgi:hypothetical protein